MNVVNSWVVNPAITVLGNDRVVDTLEGQSMIVVGREESWYDSSASCSVQPASVSEPVRSIMGRLDV